MAHRDYRNTGFVQVIVYADRIEVWNPGELPHGLTPEKLREPHAPMPRNPLLAEPLYRVKFVEKAGTGTTDMIADCLGAGLPEPTFEQNGAHFVTTIWRDWLTDAVMDELGLNERQKKGVAILSKHRPSYESTVSGRRGPAARTASRDLDELVQHGVLVRHGERKGTFYVKVRSMPQI